jgi:diguanylate cyclase (GGDEF)-like protein/PAS domain S-box-containing protein
MSNGVEEVSRTGRLPALPRMLRVGFGLIFLVLASAVLNAHSIRMSGISLVWLSNGLLIGVLLSAPKKQWPVFLVMGYIIDTGMNVVVLSAPFVTSAYYGACNIVEVVVAATFMYQAVAPRPDMTEGRQLRHLILYGSVLAPAIASSMATLFLKWHDGIPFLQSVRFWFAADLLGITIVTPLYLSFHRGEGFTRSSKLEIAGLFVLLAAVTLSVFRASDYPMLWVVLLVLLLLGVRLGFTGSALGLLLVTSIGGYLSMKGYGPIGSKDVIPLVTRILLFQVFIGSSMLALYVTEVARSANRRMLLQLEASETRFRSMAEASRDVIVLAGVDGKPRYVSPAITELVGWDPEELVGVHYRQITHPEDVPKVKESLRDMLAGLETAPLAYRSLCKDGTYSWLEATTRLMRNEQTGEPSGFVYVLRDIGDRKAAEVQMQSAFDTVERLAMMDGLTGVANRRLLDETLHREWLSARRDGTPLSVLLIDVDHFKAYNDCYGHLAGDECLRRIAIEIQSVLRRPLDLLARYGGEEFVAILPNTPQANAEAVAERVREIVEECAMGHMDSPCGVVTVSLGCATTVPVAADGENLLLKAADTALYLAKANGRNRRETAPANLLVN